MKRDTIYIRKILSMNIKKQREMLGISQEKLAECAEISTMMVKDIEGCRTWISDKTLIALADALKTDIFRFFVPDAPFSDELSKAVLHDLINAAQKIKKDIDIDLQNTLNLWGIQEKP